MKALVLFLALAVPVQASDLGTVFSKHWMLAPPYTTAVMDPTPSPAPTADPRAKVRQNRLLWNGLAFVLNIVETFVDCGQTHRIVANGGHENDAASRAIHADTNIGRCITAGAGLSLGGFVADHYWYPGFSALWTIGEGLNIFTNYGQENR